MIATTTRISTGLIGIFSSLTRVFPENKEAHHFVIRSAQVYSLFRAVITPAGLLTQVDHFQLFHFFPNDS